MMAMRSRMLPVTLGLLTLLAAPALATNGYFAHGYGVGQRGMAGAGVALELNTLAPSINPAAMVGMGRRLDLGLALFNPNRRYTVAGAPSGYPGTFGLAPGAVESGRSNFLMPALGVNTMLTPTTSLGLALFGNGGMNTDYNAATFGMSPAGVDLSQMFIAPTLAHRFLPGQSIGVSAVAAYQRFEAKGLGAFANFSSDAAHLTDLDHDNSYGGGVRVGYLGRLAPWLSAGASWQSRIWMSKLDNYAGLFAEQGGFDIPSNWTAGLAVTPMPALDLAFDVQRIDYSSVPSIANAMLPNLAQARLGDDGGAGFCWRDMTVYKVGAQYRLDDRWTFRGGYSHGRQPIPDQEVLFNILAPGVMEDHATAGFSFEARPGQTLSLAAMRAFSQTVTGPNTLEAPGQQTIDLTMDQWQFDLGWSFSF